MSIKNMTKFWMWFHIASIIVNTGIAIWMISVHEYIAIPAYIAYAVSQVKHWMW